MPDPISVLAGVSTIIDYLNRIIAFIDDIRYFRSRCMELENYARVLKSVLDRETSASLSMAAMGSMNKCVTKVLRFVQELHDMDAARQMVEVFVMKRRDGLKKEMMELVMLVLMETTSDTRISVSKIGEGLEEVKKTQSENINVIRRLVADGISSQSSIQVVARSSRVPPYHVEYKEDDPRLIFDNMSITGLSGYLQGSGPVLCVDVENLRELQSGDSITRMTEIYRRLSVGTLVQNYYGILEKKDGKLYYVMEDLRAAPTLGSWPSANGDPFKDQLLRLRIGYDIASTVAYFHSAGILVKVLSDTSIVMREKDGSVQPCLTNLEQARTFLERTSYISFDVRYEAPEYQDKRRHSKATDIWSLGICIWQTLTGRSPFNRTARPESRADKEGIRKDLANGMMPFDTNAYFEGSNYLILFDICKACCHPDPALRPTAAYITQLLLDEIQRVKAHAEAPLPSSDELSIDEAKKRAMTAIREQRQKQTKGRPLASLSLEDVKVLRGLAIEDMDPTAMFLLGAAIWHRLVDLRTFGEGSDEPIGIQPPDGVRRAHTALRYLEDAIQMGEDNAAMEAQLAHAFLASYYREEYTRI